LALLGRLSWERVDGFVMQASEKPAHVRTSAARYVYSARFGAIPLTPLADAIATTLAWHRAHPAFRLPL
jgi:hypothetical protein